MAIYQYKSTFGAVSGQPDANDNFNYSQAAQTNSNSGPIPEGLYFINPQNVQSYNDINVLNKAKSLIGLGTFPGGTDSWGQNRVWIQPNETMVYNEATGNIVYRGNFSIHGGSTPGSRGCIDLHHNANPFFRQLKQSKSSFIRLNVNYPN
ncbi:MAG: DUF2778 domain-containing protein [Bacteroidales bacterium]|jgi:hypothetical protein|nr:DUF2778 domain-containing protein [Bacteroidales bacterium]